MLRELRIQGLGVIDDALLGLSPGLNVVTGETGAGKTMVVQGLGLLLGGRSDAGLVRGGADKAFVEGIVELRRDHPAVIRAREAGAEVEDELILARTVSGQGRSRAHIGGRTAPVGVLSELGELLVAVHGQADQWRLQRPEQHRVMLDDFGGKPIASALAAYRKLHQDWQDARSELAELTERARDRAQRLDLLTSALADIERVDPVSGEDVELAAESEKLTHADGLREGAGVAHDLLAGDDDNDDAPHVIDLVARARHALGGLVAHDAELAGLDGRLRELGVLAADIAGDLASYLADLEIDPARMERVQQRRAELTALLRKYGESIDDVLVWGKGAAAEAAELAGSDDRIEALRVRLDELEPQLDAAAEKLSKARRTAARKLQKAVTEELGHLAMGSAKLTVEVSGDPAHRGAHGIDEVEILLAANAGAAPRSVAKAASGGELSRVMLALEVVTATGSVPTFVFDEVDAGVGGAAALDIGARLAQLAEHAQVIVVTHLAQVAAYADRQLVVHKSSDGHVTASGVTAVDGDERLAELARMLGGVSDSAAAREHAQELLDGASRASA
ncbi:DNA repair protein RecN [Flexivirga endophytica]|uniref:DNA repair protein RecN n=1 Tax=Flexivirga endophytica TaxID=1849103 RepID=A0A916T5Q7_9MICO|nr:DNA repair protein RecN [Flexivirga endophytica]GGB32728.1 DNA repair protein RecN [Flexivirga endophytica]GHB40713.1 DNA repair protein RecN [Flexivirga endophytica]